VTETKTQRRLPPLVTGVLAILALALMSIQLRHMVLVRDAAHFADRGDAAGCEARVERCEAWLSGPGALLTRFGRTCDVDCAP